MASLTEYTYNEIRVAVLSFISDNETGTYVGEHHVLAINESPEGFKAEYKIGPFTWVFNYQRREVKFSRGLINTPWKY